MNYRFNDLPEYDCYIEAEKGIPSKLRILNMPGEGKTINREEQLKRCSDLR